MKATGLKSIRVKLSGPMPDQPTLREASYTPQPPLPQGEGELGFQSPSPLGRGI